MKRFIRARLGFSIFLLPGTVFAHTMADGVSPFMNGLMHSVFIPSHLICLLAIGLLLGQQEPNRNLKALLIYPVVIVIGLLVAQFPIPVKLENAILIAAMSIGLLIVISLRMSVAWCAFAVTVSGFVIGLDSSLQAQAKMAGIYAMFGAGLGIVLLPLLAMEFADFFSKTSWQRISIRILGSWITASAFLVLALTFSSAKI